MDTLTFISSIVASLAWPLAAVVLALLFRRSIERLLERMTAAKVPGFEAEFEKKLKEAEKEADAANLPPPPDAAASLDGRPPTSRVFESWLELETTLNELYCRRRGATPSKYSDIREFLYSLGAEGKLPRESISIFNKLRTIRNQVVHAKADGPELTPAQAEEFSLLTARLIEQLKRID